MRRRLNWKLLLVLLVLGGALGVGMHFLHGHQLAQTAKDLREQATRTLQEGDYEKAADYLTRYLALTPGNADALAEYGTVLNVRGQPERALQAYKQVLVLDPSRRDVRRRAVDLAVQMGYWTTAAAQARVLLAQASAAERGELERVLGRCHEGKRRYPEAADAYARAVRHAPHLIEAYLRRAELLRSDHLKQPKQADLVMNNLVNYNPESFRAWLARGRYRQKWQRPGADEDLQKARDLARQAELQELDDFLDAAELAFADADLDEARKHLNRASERFANDRRLYQQLARLELGANQPGEAVTVLQSGLALLPGDRDLRVRLTEALLAAGRTEEAHQELESLRRTKQMPSALIHYLDALVRVEGKQWLEASQLLEGVRDQLAPVSDLRGQVDLLLLRCYENLGDRNQLFATFRRGIADAAKSGRRTGAARFQLGSALLAAGRLDEALREFTQALTSSDVPPAIWIRLAEANLARAWRMPREKRPPLWAEIDQHLANAEQARPGSVEVALLRAGVLAAQDKLDEAEASLRQSAEQHPQRIEFWTALVALLGQRNADPAAVRGVLDQAQQKLGDTADLRLLRARWAATQPRGEARTALASLAKDLDKFPAEEQPRLLLGLAEAFAQVGEVRDSEQLWLRYLEVQPADLRARQLLFELVLQAGNDAAAQKVVADFRQAEGEEGVHWRSCAVVRHLQQVRREGSAEDAAEARRLLDEIRQRRPKWARVLVLDGELAELEGRTDEAAAKYQRAIDQGERSPRLIQRTVELLNETHQYKAADQLIAKLGEGGPAGDVLRWRSVEASLRANDFARAETVARAAAQANPNDHRQQLWFGLVLAAAGKGDEAEKALQRAAALAGQLPETWIALVQLQVRRDPKKAEATVQQAHEKVPPENAALTLGPCYELLGQREKATEYYLAALAARPNDPGVLRVVALYFARAGDPTKAEALLRRLLEPAVKAPEALAAWARRTLAVSLAGGDYRRFKEGIQLLEENARRTGGSPEDQRARAVLHKELGQRHEAIRLLEELGKAGPLSLQDQFLLAQLYEAVGSWAAADQYLAAVTAASPDAAALAYYARGLLRHGDAARARPLVEKLEKQEPKALATLELQARLLHAEGQGERAPELFQAVLQEAKEPTVVGLVAVLLEELGQSQAAEAAYRAFAERSQLPASLLSLAQFLGLKGRVPEALDLCEQAAAQSPPEVVAGVMAGVARRGKANKAQASRVEAWIRAALDARGATNDAATVALLTAQANLFDYQARYADAIQSYRRALAIHADDPTTRNNLAWLIAVHDRRGAAEALKLVTHAIENLTGPNPVLLDTRATVLLALGRNEEAIQDLQTAVAEAPSPVRYFHLAQAYRQARRRPEAKEALELAKSLGLQAANLHPLELTAYKTISAEFGIK